MLPPSLIVFLWDIGQAFLVPNHKRLTLPFMSFQTKRAENGQLLTNSFLEHFDCAPCGFKIAKLLPTGFQRKSRTGLCGLNFGRKGGGA